MPLPLAEPPVAKNDKPRSKNPAKPSASTDKPGERQINFRANPLLVSRLDNVAAAFGIDV